jgi:hypothetical protein
VPLLPTTTNTSSSTSETGVNVEKLHRELHEGISSLCIFTDHAFNMLLTELNLCKVDSTSNGDLFMCSEAPPMSSASKHGKAAALPSQQWIGTVSTPVSATQSAAHSRTHSQKHEDERQLSTCDA